MSQLCGLQAIHREQAGGVHWQLKTGYAHENYRGRYLSGSWNSQIQPDTPQSMNPVRRKAISKWTLQNHSIQGRQEIRSQRERPKEQSSLCPPSFSTWNLNPFPLSLFYPRKPTSFCRPYFQSYRQQARHANIWNVKDTFHTLLSIPFIITC